MRTTLSSSLLSLLLVASAGDAGATRRGGTRPGVERARPTVGATVARSGQNLGRVRGRKTAVDPDDADRAGRLSAVRVNTSGSRHGDATPPTLDQARQAIATGQMAKDVATAQGRN